MRVFDKGLKGKERERIIDDGLLYAQHTKC